MVELVDTRDLKSLGDSHIGSNPITRTNLGVKMKNEADFKRIFKNSIRAHKGFSLSLAAPMICGIPDLYVILPYYCPVLLEAKWLGEVPSTFKRKIPYSALQKEWMQQCWNVNPFTAYGLIGFKYEDNIYAVLTTPVTEIINYEFKYMPHAVYAKETKTFNLQSMLDNCSIPKL